MQPQGASLRTKPVSLSGRAPGSRANGSFPKHFGRLWLKKSASGRQPPTASAFAWRSSRPSAHVGFLRSRPPDTPHRISLRLAARLLRLPLKGGVIALGARASRPHPVPLAAAELQCDAAGSHPVGGNSIGQAVGEPWRRSRLIQVGEMAEAVPGLVRAGRRAPASREAIIP